MLKIPRVIVTNVRVSFLHAEFHETLMHLLPGDTFCVSGLIFVIYFVDTYFFSITMHVHNVCCNYFANDD